MRVIKRGDKDEYVFISENDSDTQLRHVIRTTLLSRKGNKIIIHLESFDHRVKCFLDKKVQQCKRNKIVLKFLFIPIKFFKNYFISQYKGYYK